MDDADPRPADPRRADAAAPDATARGTEHPDVTAGVEDATDGPTGSPVEAAADAAAPVGSHPVLVYTGLRLAILVGVGAVLYLLGARGLLLLVFAFLISGLVAMVALRRPREGAVQGITTSVRKVNDRIDAASRAEDDDDIDEVMGEIAPAPQPSAGAGADPSADPSADPGAAAAARPEGDPEPPDGRAT